MCVCSRVWLSYSVGYAAQTLGAGPLRRLQVQRWRTPLMSVRAWLCMSPPLARACMAPVPRLLSEYGPHGQPCALSYSNHDWTDRYRDTPHTVML